MKKSERNESGNLFSDEEILKCSGVNTDFSDLPFPDKTETDKDLLLYAQYKFRNGGDLKSLDLFYKTGIHAGLNFAKKICKSNKNIQHDTEFVKMAVHDAVADIIVKLQNDIGFRLTEPASYIYKRVFSKLNPYKTETERNTLNIDINDYLSFWEVERYGTEEPDAI